MLARVLADAGADGGHRGLVQQRARPAADRAAGRPTDTRYLVLEMGARGVGHLAELCAIAPPDVSLVLNVGKAHIGEFGSQEHDRAGQGRARRGALADDGVAVLNADDPLVAAMAARTAAGCRDLRRATGADVRLGDVEVDDLGRAVLRPGPRRRDRARRAPPASASTRPQRRRRRGHRAGRRARPSPTSPTSLRAIDRLSPWRMEVHERADGLVVRQRRLQRQPRLDAGGARDARRDGRARRPAHGRGARARCASSARSARRRAPRGRRAGARGWASTSSSSSGEGARAIHDGARRRAGRRRHDAPRRAPSNRRRVVARQCRRVPTSCWSRRPGPGGSNGSPTRCWETGPSQTGDADRRIAWRRSPRDPMRAILLAGGLVPALHAGRHPLRDPGAGQQRLRPADPRRRPDDPPHQARHARRWAAW